MTQRVVMLAFTMIGVVSMAALTVVSAMVSYRLGQLCTLIAGTEAAIV
ncbi:hypothetical protein [Nonomuraea sp. B5E05]